MNLKEKINYLLSTKTVSHSAITFSSTLINGLLGIIFFIILARNLGPAGFGLVSVAITTFILIADITDLGVNTGIINFVSKYSKSNLQKSYRFMKLALKIKVLTWVVVGFGGGILAPLIAENILLKKELTFSIQLSLVGVGGALLFSFATNSLLAFQRYWHWGAVTILSNSFRLLLIFILLGSVWFNENSALISYLSAPFLGFIIGLVFLPADFFKVVSENQVAGEFFNYNKWIILVAILGAIILRLDTFLTARFLTITQVGIYSVASQLSMVVPQITFALASVVAPKLASFSKDEIAKKYLIRLQFLCLGLAAIGLLGIPLSFLVIPFYGSFFEQAVAPFAILLLSQLLFLVSIPSHQAIFYYFSQPKVFVFFTLGQLLILTLTGFFLIPLYGVIGAALSVFFGTLFNFIAPSIWVIRKFRHGKAQ